ncbi:MAG: 4Fe-4S dicluster domain-containing protein [Bacteroidales bacterium]|jgi:L-lactate utilization protein LutB|nr:4Fe-4S dicluster domain-containing protein [Bacteroidales bacterium]
MPVEKQIVRNRANLVRHNYIEEMEKHLLAFEAAANAHDLSVHWIIDESALVDFVQNLMPKSRFNKVCFDFGKIPDGIKNDNSGLFQFVKIEDFNDNSAEYLFVEADYGIVENGSIALVNKRSGDVFNKVQKLVLLLNINNLVVKQSDLELVLALKQRENESFLPHDIKIITSPFHYVKNETFITSDDEKVNKNDVSVTILLYDNGITEIMENNVLRESLYCIQCGRCSEVCPVYKHTNGFTPIELVKHNSFYRNHLDQNIFKSTTLCGYCEEVCPIDIPLMDLLVAEMEMVNARTNKERNIDTMKIFAKRSKLNKMNGSFRRIFFLRKMYGKNKKIHNYYKTQNENFYSITKTSKE